MVVSTSRKEMSATTAHKRASLGPDKVTLQLPFVEMVCNTPAYPASMSQGHLSGHTFPVVITPLRLS